MAIQIRQEINILNSVISMNTAADVDSSEIVQLDTTQYNGTVTYYFEAVVKNNSLSSSYSSFVQLQRAGTATADAILTVNIPANSGYTLYRSAAFTPPAGQTSYTATITSGGSANNDLQVKAARIVIIQNATTLTNTETQIEIGNASSTTTTTDTALTNPKYWQYVAANWDGTITAYFESTFKTGTSKSAATMTLQESASITAPSWSNVASSAVTTTSTTATRVRSGAITLTDGNWYRAVMKAGNSKSGITVYNAKVIVDQEGPSALAATYYFDGHTSITDDGAAWTNDANAFDGSTSTNAFSSTNAALLVGIGTTAPTSGNSVASVQMRTFYSDSLPGTKSVKIYDKNDVFLGLRNTPPLVANWSSYVVLTKPSYGWGWADINNGIKVKCECNSGGTIFRVYKVELDVYTYTSVGITKLEPQYLLANTLFAAGTSLQTSLTKWDSTEWSGVTNTYTFQAEAADNSTSDIELWAADGSGSALATVTNADNAGQASATLGTTKDLDVKATTNAGDIAAARILVATSVTTTPANTSNFFLMFMNWAN